MGGGGGSSSGDSQPRGVTIRGGKMKASTPTSSLDRTTDMQREAKATTAGKEFGVMTIEQRREKAISDLEGRLETPQLPRVGFGGVATGAVSEMNLKRQIEALRAGGDPNFARTATGEYVAVGVTTSKGTMGQQGDIVGMSPVQRGSTLMANGGDTTPAVTPEVTPEVVPDDMQTAMLSGEVTKTRRTRGKRFGGAGSGEGEGILVRRT